MYIIILVDILMHTSTTEECGTADVPIFSLRRVKEQKQTPRHLNSSQNPLQISAVWSSSDIYLLVLIYSSKLSYIFIKKSFSRTGWKVNDCSFLKEFYLEPFLGGKETLLQGFDI